MEPTFYHFYALLRSEKQVRCLDSTLLAPDRAPHNIQWTMIGSTLSLHWDPVVAMETESKVTGYLVRASLKQMESGNFEQACLDFFSRLRCS